MTTPRPNPWPTPDAPYRVSARPRPRRRTRGPPACPARRTLRPPVRARRLRGGPGGRPPGPARPTPWSARPSRPSSTWPTGGPPAARRTVATGPASSSRSPTTSTPTSSTSTCPPAATTPPASPSCPGTPTRPPPPGGAIGKLAGEEGLEVLGWRARARRTTPRWARSPRRPCPSMHQLFVAPSPGTVAGRCRPGPGHRPPGLRAAQAGRARDRRVLLGLPVGPDHHLQGDAHLPPAGRVLPRPLRRAGDQRSGPGALAVLHQHLPVVAAGPPLPLPGPQRRDQHRWPATATGCGPARPCAPPT